MPEWRLLLRVAREETGRYFRGFNRRVLLFILVAAVVGAILLPPILDRGVVPDEDLYRAEVTPSSPLRGALEDDRRFEVHRGVGGEFAAGNVDILVLGRQVYYDDTERGTAALHDFSDFAQRWFDQRLAFEPNQSAAFPVRVNVVYQPRALGAAGLPRTDLPATTGGNTSSQPYEAPTASLVLNQSGESQLDLTPGKVEPPFPMRSLLLTFLYLVPMNFISQYYAGSLLGERTRSRGMLLLAAPLTGPQILFGKTLPYIVLTLLLAVGITIYLGAGIVSLVAILPVLAFFLAATSFSALVARSYRELTFFVTTMSVGLSTFLFRPAIFTQVHPIAFISPISVVASQLRGESVPLASVVYSMTPLTFAAVVLSVLATSLYREESLFAPRGVVAKVLDAIHLLAHTPRGFLVAGIVVLPFVFAAELFMLAFAVTLPLRLAVVTFLIGVAVIEELSKALPSVAHFRASRTPRSPLVTGVAVGVGFFLGEKVGLLLSLVGLDLIPLGNTLLTNYGVAASVFVVFAPLLLHVATATITAYGARSGRWTLLIALPVAIAVHVAYNLAVIDLAT